MKPTAIIVDVDGTLAHMNGRSPYDPSKYHEDTVDEVVRNLVHRYANDHIIIVCSGRDDTYRDVTAQWLDDNGVDWEHLIMRKGGDRRNDALVKQELYERHIAPNYDVQFVLDDRNRVVNMWRSLGLKCLQVADGDF